MKHLLTILGSVSLMAPMTLGIVACSTKNDEKPDQPDPDDETSRAGEELINKNFLAYYRAWRDKEMHGVNTDIKDENWITMNDIPYGINVVNVFSYVPPGQEELAQPFFDKLQTEYGPNLHQRGIKLIRGFDYDKLYKWWTDDQEYTKIGIHDDANEGYPDSETIKAYADQLYDELVNINGFHLDGLDIDMEQSPSKLEIQISNDVIKELGTKIGPKSDNKDTLFLYDTNGENVAPLTEVADYFDLLPYQQYGDDSSRTKNEVLPAYEKIMGKDKIMPGLTFPEEKDKNRWVDTASNYEESHFYDVAKFVNDNDLGGMFVYALDRDGRNYEDDLTTIRESNMLWTKTAILEANGVSLATARDLAIHYLHRVQYDLHLSKTMVTKLEKEIADATNLLEINAVIMGHDYPEGISPTYDPILENNLFKINFAPAHEIIKKAQDLSMNRQLSDEGDALKKVLEKLMGSKTFTQADLDEAVANLNNEITSNKEK